MAYEQDKRNDPLTGTTTQEGFRGTTTATTSGATSGTTVGTSSPAAYSAVGSDVPQNAGRVRNERDDRESAAIERDIDHTRSKLDSTVDALAARLKPASILDDVLDYFASDEGDRTTSPTKQKAKRIAGRAGSSAWDKVKANPVPSALIGAGIAYLFLKSDDDAPEYDDYGTSRSRIARRSAEPQMYGGSYVDARTGQPYDVDSYGDDYDRSRAASGRRDYEYERSRGSRGSQGPGVLGTVKEYAGEAVEGVKSAAGYVAGAAGSAASAVGGAASSAVHGVGSAASSAAGAVGDAASSAASGLSSAAGETRDYAGSASHSVGQYGSNRAADAREAGTRYYAAARQKAGGGYAYSRERLDYGLQEYPLAAAVAALATGVLAGLLIPRTRVEDEYFGEYAHDVKDQAGDLAGEAYDRGRRVANAGLSAAQDSAGREGVTADSLKGGAAGLVGHLAESAGRVANAAIGSATEAARHVGDDVSKVVKDEAQDIKSDAESKGLTPSQLADKAKHVAQDTADAAKDTGQKEVDRAKEKHDVKA